MWIDVIVDGNTYSSPTTTKITHTAAAEAFFDKLGDLNRFKLQLKNGGDVLVIGKDALQRAQFIFRA